MLFESGEVGSREEFDACFGEQERLGLFIRKLVGLDREAAKKAFSMDVLSAEDWSRRGLDPRRAAYAAADDPASWVQEVDRALALTG